MELQEKARAWKRLGLAVALVATPVASLGLSSGTASAGIESYVVDFECDVSMNPSVTVTVNSDPGGSGKVSVHMRADSANAWSVDAGSKVVTNSDWDDSPFTVSAIGATPLASGSTYDVKIVSGNGNANQTALFEETITVACAGLTFPEEIDDFVTYYCPAEGDAYIVLTMPQREPVTAKGPKYDVTILEDAEEGFDETVNLDQGEVEMFVTGEGTFAIDIYMPGEEEAVYSNEITVDCSVPGGGGGGNYNLSFLLKKPVTLPSTGSDINVLLIAGPLSLLAGLGMVLARRRFANA